ncbi:MAG TPA: hypothetical protein PKY77_02595 [Phycisphaerae bacterium]|nr:hypothetical protein [Phycisphaerae bacterium]HRY66633.1 hypothetical protein [Phycisphaerae bacterium]HSA29090.1 hypothetical protein [Phycisphaerae bacterium]
MIVGCAKHWLPLFTLVLLCVMGLACAPQEPTGPPIDPPGTPVDADRELAEALGGDLSEVTGAEEAEAEADLAILAEADEDLQSLLASTGDEEAAKAEMVNRLSSNPAVEWAEASSFGIAIRYADGTETGIALDLEDDDPPGMVDGGGDAADGSDFLPAKTSRTMKSADLVESRKTILLNPHYWERQGLTNHLVATANSRFRECGFDDFVVYRDEECRIAKFMRLSDYGVVHIYSHGLAWPSKHNAQRVYVMTGHIATAKSLAFMKSRGLVPHKVTYARMPYLDQDTRKPVYVLSADFLTQCNDLSQSKSLVYLGFCHSHRAGFQAKIVDEAHAQAALGMNWVVSTKKNVAWAEEMYNALGNTSPDAPVDLRAWYGSAPHQYARQDQDASGNPVTVTVRLHAKGNGDLILWEKPETMDPCLARAIRRQLGLADNAELTSADLGRVTYLEAMNVGIRTLAGIQGCTNLKTLNLLSNEVEDLSPLAELTMLENLYMVDNKIRSVAPLAPMTSLKSLDVMHNFIGSISSLSGLTRLETLKVDWQQNKAITSLNGVQNMAKLKWLGCSGNSITSLAPVAGLSSLQTLNATHNDISGYTGVTGLPNLRTLRLTENPVDSLSGLIGAAFLGNRPSIDVTCCPIDTNCDPDAGSTTQCDLMNQLKSAGATIIWGDRSSCGTEPPLLGIAEVHATCDAQ